ncbi:MAG: hypothetical protein RMH74_01625, partial [Candidatus Caldarchaeum sp.]|nr:hypothetical protein [Candidatus Caldarchaeum sp.]
QLYQVDPSGTAFTGDAFTVGMNSDKALDIIENEYSPDLSLEEALKLIISVVERTGNQEPAIQYGYITADKPFFTRHTINGKTDAASKTPP